MSDTPVINIHIRQATINLAPSSEPMISWNGGATDVSGIVSIASTAPVATAPSASGDLEWSGTLADGKTVNFKKAEAAIAKLNESLPAGEPQWRMPSRRELESIQDLTRHDPCVDLEKYPDTKSGYYWSSTPCAWSSAYAWFVGFSYGNSYDGRRDSNGAFVRAVRAVPSGQ